MMTYTPDKASVANSDKLMEVDLYIHDAGDINIFHNQRFQNTLSWIEYDINNGRIDFIMEDGDLRNFGIPVDPKAGPYLQNTHLISVVLMNGATPIEEQFVPLITHGA